jgi:hypothetical protein
LGELLARMNVPDKEEIEQLQLQLKQEKQELSSGEMQRIADVLSIACDRIGSLSYEEAFWVLIPMDPDEAVTWIQASGKGEQDYTHVRLPNEVEYAPDSDEVHRLLSLMRSSAWVLHIHNHPQSPEETECYGASAGDAGFLKHWKHLRPELTAKMKFFVVSQNTAFEYTGEQAHAVQWLGERPQNTSQSKTERDEKYLTRRVMKMMRREEIRKKIDEMLGEG